MEIDSYGAEPKEEIELPGLIRLPLQPVEPKIDETPTFKVDVEAPHWAEDTPWWVWFILAFGAYQVLKK